MKDKLKSKIKLPQIDPDDFPYKFYMCWWSDIISDSGWNTLNHISKSKPATCITMGWLISTKNNKYVFVGDINFNDDGTVNEGGNSTVIPKSNVLKLKEIKL
jgi:hypothetical protein|tara:strand:+ start:77 stop:382 length:306 start_codon:yes stop_codon:yes gene_type:complete